MIRIALWLFFVQFVAVSAQRIAPFSCSGAAQTLCNGATYAPYCYYDMTAKQCLNYVKTYVATSTWTEPPCRTYDGNKAGCPTTNCVWIGNPNNICEMKYTVYTSAVNAAPADETLPVQNSAMWSVATQLPVASYPLGAFAFTTQTYFRQQDTTDAHWFMFAVGSQPNSDRSGWPNSCISTSTPTAVPSNYTAFPYPALDIDTSSALMITRFRHLNFESIRSNTIWPLYNNVIFRNRTYMNQPFQNGTEYWPQYNRTWGQILMGQPNDLIQTVDITGTTMDRLNWTWHLQLPSIVKCPGVLNITVGTLQKYIIPTAFMIVNSRNETDIKYSTYHVLRDTTTGVLTFPAQSRFATSATVTNATTTSSDCGATGILSRLVLDVKVKHFGVPVDSVAGPRSIADLYLKPRSAPASTVLNAYFDTFVNFVAPTCSMGVCTWMVRMQSECRTRTTDGDTFINVAYANATNRIAAYGSSYSYPTSLNARHDIYIDMWLCTGSVLGPCARTHSTDSGTEDVIPIASYHKAYARTTVRPAFVDVASGLLPLTSLLDVSSISWMTSVRAQTDPYATGANAPVVTTYRNETRNRALTFYGNLTPLVWIPTPLWNTSYTIVIDPTTVVLTPVSTTGDVVGNSLTYTQLLPYLVYVSRSTAASSSCSSCAMLPIVVANSKGVDGFSIPSYSLAQIVAGSFQGMRIQMQYTITSTNYVPGANRRLLNAAEPDTLDDDATTNVLTETELADMHDSPRVLPPPPGGWRASVSIPSTTPFPDALNANVYDADGNAMYIPDALKTSTTRLRWKLLDVPGYSEPVPVYEVFSNYTIIYTEPSATALYRLRPKSIPARILNGLQFIPLAILLVLGITALIYMIRTLIHRLKDHRRAKLLHDRHDRHQHQHHHHHHRPRSIDVRATGHASRDRRLPPFSSPYAYHALEHDEEND